MEWLGQCIQMQNFAKSSTLSMSSVKSFGLVNKNNFCSGKQISTMNFEWKADKKLAVWFWRHKTLVDKKLMENWFFISFQGFLIMKLSKVWQSFYIFKSPKNTCNTSTVGKQTADTKVLLDFQQLWEGDGQVHSASEWGTIHTISKISSIPKAATWWIIHQ